MATDPIEGQVLLLTAAKASVPAAALPDLLEHAQTAIVADFESLHRRCERVYEDDDRVVYLAETGFWDRICDSVELEPRECRAVKRAHREQFFRIGRRQNRQAEFEAALEIREPVCVSQSDCL